MPHDLADPACYKSFLQIQLGARIPVEDWLEKHAEEALVPPSQTANIRADLEELDASSAVEILPFALAGDADALGVAWVLAGSHLGNRVLLKSLPENQKLPSTFLTDRKMGEFWNRLQPRLQQERSEQEIRSTVRSAKAVFTLFLQQVEEDSGRLAA